MNLKNIKLSSLLWDFLYLTAACVITAFSVNYILKPNGLITSGTTGLSIIIEKYTGINYSIVVYGFTFSILAVTFLLMGKREVIKILFLSVLYPTVLFVMQSFEISFIENDLLLATIYFSIFYGVGVGMALRKGFSYGGTDTIARVLNKKVFPSVNVSNILLAIDGTIILIGAFTFGRNIALYTIISQFIVTKIIDYIMFGFGSKLYKLSIISEYHEEISRYIMYELKRGVTLFSIRGGYTNASKLQMDTVCSPRESVMIREYIKKLDSKAFVEVIPIISVWGIGSRFVNITQED